jgi:hypothetical protein
MNRHDFDLSGTHTSARLFFFGNGTLLGVISVKHINHHVVHTAPIATAASKAMIITVFGWAHVRVYFCCCCCPTLSFYESCTHTILLFVTQVLERKITNSLFDLIYHG